MAAMNLLIRRQQSAVSTTIQELVSILSIWRELDVPNWLLKVEVVQDSRAFKVDEKCASICAHPRGSARPFTER